MTVYINFLPRHYFDSPEMFRAKVLSSTGPGCESTGLGWESTGPRCGSTGPGCESTGPRCESTGPRWESTGLRCECTGPRMWKYWTLDGKVLVLGCANYFPELLPEDK